MDSGHSDYWSSADVANKLLTLARGAGKEATMHITSEDYSYLYAVMNKIEQSKISKVD